jgi:hypothetical protein
MVKAVAASRSVSVSSHGELFSYVRGLGEELGAPSSGGSSLWPARCTKISMRIG